jgi:thiol-disulfide isomerase/thioredoxin
MYFLWFRVIMTGILERVFFRWMDSMLGFFSKQGHHKDALVVSVVGAFLAVFLGISFAWSEECTRGNVQESHDVSGAGFIHQDEKNPGWVAFNRDVGKALPAKDPVLGAGFIGLSQKIPLNLSKAKMWTAGEFLKSRKRPILLVLWSTMCRPCISELPDLDKIQGKFKGVLDVIPVLLDRNYDKAKGIFRDKGITRLPLMAVAPHQNPNAFFPKDLSQQGIPFLMIYDSQGRRVFQHVGSMPLEDLLDRLNRLGIQEGRKKSQK